MMEKTREAQSSSLNELQQELKSLKTLLLSQRRPANGSTTPEPESSANGSLATTPAGNSRFGISNSPFPAKPGLPSWQLAGNNSKPAANGISASKTEDKPASSRVEDVKE